MSKIQQVEMHVIMQLTTSSLLYYQVNDNEWFNAKY